VPEVESPAHLRVERVEQEPEEAVVPRLQHLDAHRAEPIAELEIVWAAASTPSMRPKDGDAPGEGDGELEAGLGLVGPALELVLGGKPAEGGVELHRVQPACVEAQEVRRLRFRRVEVALPGGVREAGRAGVEAAGGYEPSMTS
jgi:hypothetical protein